ncbi:MAG TPA: hypothetical protein PKY60_10585 [Thermoflexales bacterium]|nr:hypothetical protein [Thermoflexales bacterium]
MREKQPTPNLISKHIKTKYQSGAKRDTMKNISKIIIAALLAITFALSAQPVKAETTPSNQTICGAIGGDF